MDNIGIFLNRDGIIHNVIIKDGKVCPILSFEQFELVPNIKNDLEKINALGFKIFVVINNEIYTEPIDEEIDKKINSLLYKDFRIEEIVRRSKYKQVYGFKRPLDGVIKDLADRRMIDCRRSFFIGNNSIDIDSAKTLGLRTILVNAIYNFGTDSDYKVDSFKEAVSIIEANIRKEEREKYENNISSRLLEKN